MKKQNVKKIEAYFFRLFLFAGILCGAVVIGDSQAKPATATADSIIWLRNNRSAGNRQTTGGDYYEDSFYGIEQIEKPLPFGGGEFDDPYRARQGSGGGNGLGSADNQVSRSPVWIPYYQRPSNCRTADYQPAISPDLMRADATAATRRARIVYQPRPLYSKDDYLARRGGSIRLRVVLNADGTVGSVRPLSKLSGNLTNSALRAACYQTFYPAIVNGKPTGSTEIVTYTFNPEQVHQDEAAKYPPPAPATATVKIISKPRPAYTPEAKQNGITGTVTLRVTFLATGAIGEVLPIEKLPDGLTEQAIEAARRMSFEPARKNGKNIAQTRTVQYNFTLY